MRTLDKRGILYAVAAQRCVTASAACRAIELASHDSSSDPCSRPWQRADQSEARRARSKIVRGGTVLGPSRVCLAGARSAAASIQCSQHTAAVRRSIAASSRAAARADLPYRRNSQRFTRRRRSPRELPAHAAPRHIIRAQREANS